MAKVNVEQLTDHELLVELVKQQRSDTKHQKIVAYVGAAILAVLVVVCILLVPRAISLMNEAQDVMDEAQVALVNINELAENADATVTQLSSLEEEASGTLEGINEVVANLDELVSENTAYINDAAKDLSEIDFEGLNDSINALKSVVEPLANLFGR